MARESEFLGRRPWAMAAAVLGSAMLVIYITLIVRQGGISFLVVPWALLMALAALGAFFSAQVEDRHIARRFVIGSAVLFALLGVAAGLSIGFGFLIAAGFSTVAAKRMGHVVS